MRSHTVFHQWMGGSRRMSQGFRGNLVGVLPLTVLAIATKVIVKTPHEAHWACPPRSQCCRITRYQTVGVEAERPGLPLYSRSCSRSDIIRRRCVAPGKSWRNWERQTLLWGTVAAIRSRSAGCTVCSKPVQCRKSDAARDNVGAVRFLETGNMPFTQDLIDFHRQKLEERARYEKRAVSFQNVIDDSLCHRQGVSRWKARYNK